jgi:predicted O-linked N-acetylglucosamine transferase (SPINDLY family)
LFVALVEAFKITPGIFSVWASVLKRVEGSMLLLPRWV